MKTFARTLKEVVTIGVFLSVNFYGMCQCPDDYDCDGVSDLNDLDDDNDGITDLEELSNCINFSTINTTGQLLFDEDFGAGSNWGPQLPVGTISYCYQDGLGSCFQPSWVPAGQFWITDGQYSLLNNPNVGFPSAFRNQDDHTPNDIDGYQVVINADFTTGEIYRKNNIAIPSSNFQVQTVVFSAWISNIGSEDNQTYCSNNGGLISPNVDFVLEDGFGNPIGTPISSGNLPFMNNGANAWVQYTAVFQVTGISAVNIVIKNNAPGGCGNDLAIDDITIYYADVDCDFDQDGIPDYLDLDSDNDGIYDVIEGGDGLSDTNGDGMIDINDVGFLDANSNGVNDISESTPPVHSDNDGLPDYLDLDSDDDGCFDTVEAGYQDPDDDGILGTSPVIVNGYGVIQNQSGYMGTMPAVTIAGGQLPPDFNYPQLVFCIGESAVLPNIVGSSSGIFSTPLSGLDLNGITGEIAPSLSSIGSYQVTYTPDEICLGDTTLTITIVDVPAINPISDIILCEGDQVGTIVFTGTGVTYDWTNSNTLIGLSSTGIGDILAFNSTVSGTAQVVTIEVTPSVGVCAGNPESFTITLNPQDNSSISYPLSACQSDNEVLAIVSGTTGGVFSASPTGLSLEATTGTITPNNSVQGVYTITYQSGAACPNESIAPFEISIAPTITSMSDVSICDGESIVFPLITTGNPSDNIQWEILPFDNLGIGNSGVGGTIASVVGVNSGSTPITATISAYATSDLGCVGPTETFDVIVNPIPEVDFSGDILSGCEPHEVQFTYVTNIPSVDCHWDFGNGVTSDLCDQLTQVFMAGSYDVSLTITSDAGCSNSVSYMDYINAYPSPIAAFNFTPSQLDILNTDVQFFNSSSNATNYIWDFGDASSTTTDINPLHTFPNVPGSNYTITLWAFDDDFQCSDSVQHTISIEDALIYYVPNAFTPDDDEFNQTFQPVFTAGYDPYDFHLAIFNRWGELIFESYNAEEGWDGTYNGRIVQDGTYTWTIHFKTTNTDERIEVVGHLNLIR
ncbi:MAG: gliding motility-associated C-terminal domain-containing protein [Crocinitomicaceae bacterium]|nr:gliding motility-associated C-terminal domain-containing protein [Flavobacteriales bacterium]NQZ34010.1 gliding motility-associated C-terminal domain-containing protein [Crocinitomicaceae bacterium]